MGLSLGAANYIFRPYGATSLKSLRNTAVDSHNM